MQILITSTRTLPSQVGGNFRLFTKSSVLGTIIVERPMAAGILPPISPMAGTEARSPIFCQKPKTKKQKTENYLFTTTSTGQGADPMTRSVTLPMRSREIPLRPWLPRMMRSTPYFRAA